MPVDALLQVPTELWCHTWNFLPMEDVVAASQTCKRWRSVAINCPTLWSELEYVSSLHPHVCDCGKCIAEEFSNFQLLRDILPRSTRLPIIVKVSLLHELCNGDDLERLAVLLRPELHRLRALHIRTLDLDGATLFLEEFDALLSLRALYVGVDIDFRVTNSIVSLAQTLALPALEVLEVRGDFFFHDDPPTLLSFPALTRLVPGFASSRELLGYLEICPRLEYLQLRVADRGLAYDGSDVHGRVRSAILRMHGCRAIEIVDMKLDQKREEEVILRIFDSLPTSRVALSYEGSADVHTAAGLRILSAVSRPTAVSLALDMRSDGEYLVTSLKDGALERSVAFLLSPAHREQAVSFMWSHISLLAVQRVALTVDARLWSVRPLDVGLLRATQHLTMLFRSGRDDLDLENAPVRAHPLSSLEHLRIVAVSERVDLSRTLGELRESWLARRRLSQVHEASTIVPVPVRFPAGYLRRLVRSLNLDHHLELIAVDSDVVVEGDVGSEVADLARVFVRCTSKTQMQT